MAQPVEKLSAALKFKTFVIAGLYSVFVATVPDNEATERLRQRIEERAWPSQRSLSQDRYVSTTAMPRSLEGQPEDSVLRSTPTFGRVIASLRQYG
jgi:hypothetical protein